MLTRRQLLDRARYLPVVGALATPLAALIDSPVVQDDAPVAGVVGASNVELPSAVTVIEHSALSPNFQDVVTSISSLSRGEGWLVEYEGNHAVFPVESGTAQLVYRAEAFTYTDAEGNVGGWLFVKIQETEYLWFRTAAQAAVCASRLAKAVIVQE